MPEAIRILLALLITSSNLGREKIEWLQVSSLYRSAGSVLDERRSMGCRLMNGDGGSE